LGPGCVNWDGNVTRGLRAETDRLHELNYGACMAARRRDLLRIGGADEHLDYLGYLCGPYEMTFRLVNAGMCAERWLEDEFLHHVWHPNTGGCNTDYQGPSDGRGMALRARDAGASNRVAPKVRTPLLRRWPRRPALADLLAVLARRPEPAWRAGAQPAGPSDEVYWADREVGGFNVFCHRGGWFAVPA